MTCKDCVHDSICCIQRGLSDIADVDKIVSQYGCEDYKNKSDYVTKDEIAQLMWERDKAIEQLRSYGVDFCQEKKELAEVKHGEWIEPTGKLKRFEGRYVICSHCNVMLPIIIELGEYYYCPNCGAKMDGRSETCARNAARKWKDIEEGKK